MGAREGSQLSGLKWVKEKVMFGGGGHFTEEHDRLCCLGLQTVFQPVVFNETGQVC